MQLTLLHGREVTEYDLCYYSYSPLYSPLLHYTVYLSLSLFSKLQKYSKFYRYKNQKFPYSTSFTLVVNIALTEINLI